MDLSKKIENSRKGLRTGMPAVKKGTQDQVAQDPMPEGEVPFQVPETETRREALVRMAGWGLFAGVSLTGVAMFQRFFAGGVSFDPKQVFSAGAIEQYPKDTVNEDYKDGFQVWMVNTRYKGKQILCALSTICTHLGCTPNWLEADRKFKCPCHGSGFYTNGINFEGPAPRPLERFKIFIGDDGRVMVDKTKKFQEEKGEWTSPDSYIVV